MARKRRQTGNKKGEVGDYRHEEAKRKNNPEVGLANWEPKAKTPPKVKYEYDPFLDPQLQWAGKAERLSFEVDTVSLHIHERVSTQAVINTLKKNGKRKKQAQFALELFADPQLPLDQAVEFYQHDVDWANRLILGDSLLVMNSLLQRELMAGRVQMIYLDPPYGVNYKSNFQPSVKKPDPTVQDKDDNLTREPEQIKAYRDTWTLGIHSYLTYLRNRLLLTRELLSQTGSVFVQIGDVNVHYVRTLLDEVFGSENFVAQLAFKKTAGLGSKGIPAVCDYLLWYAKDSLNVKIRRLFQPKPLLGDNAYSWLELEDGIKRKMSKEEQDGLVTLPEGSRIYRQQILLAAGLTQSCVYEVEFDGDVFKPTAHRSWSTNQEGMNRLIKGHRVIHAGKTLNYVRYLDDFPVIPLGNLWEDTASGSGMDKIYVVQTNTKVIERCMLMTTDPGDLVFDPTCGSGTTAYVAEQWGRRWITCDTSRVALALARQRLLTATFDYYQLAHPEQGVDAGFVYETVPHITLKSIAQNTKIDEVYDRYQKEMEPLRTDLNRLLKESWEEWEIPREADDGWPDMVKETHRLWWELRRERQQAVERLIAEGAAQETLYDKPLVERGKVRVSGPFTVESIPVPAIEDPSSSPIEQWETLDPDARKDDIARRGRGVAVAGDAGTNFILDMIDAMKKAGINRVGGGTVRFSKINAIKSASVLQAEGEILLGEEGTEPRNLKELSESVTSRDALDLRPTRSFGISFGPRYGPVTLRQVEDAVNEARGRYDGVVIVGFTFDAPAQEFLKRKLPVEVMGAYINPDVLVGDLLKTSKASQIFTLFGQADIAITKTKEGHVVEVRGVDLYDPQTGEVHSDRGKEIAAWFLDTNYDDRCFNICQAFFPGGGKNPWQRLARALRGTVNEEAFEDLRSLTSIPFKPGKKIAVKVIDHRGNEMLEVFDLSDNGVES